MPRSSAALEALIHELDEVRVLAGREDDPTLSEASLAVARALASLNHLGHRRFHMRPQPEDSVDQVISDARRALARAREALAGAASVRRARMDSTADAEPSGEAQTGAVAVSCCGCGRRFFVKYRGSGTAELVTFPMACPWEECDAVTDAAYPTDAVEIEVVAAPVR